MKKLLMMAFVLVTIQANAQTETSDEKKPFFTKEKLFTGGSVGIGFGSNTFSFGLGPHIGYSVNEFIDVAISLNYNYVSQRDPLSIYKVRQSIIGPGAFLRLYPFSGIFAQAQYEYNFVKYSEIPGGGFPDIITKYKVPSLLIGGGYANGRENSGDIFYYICILFDVADNKYSPYKDQFNRELPIIRTGINFPLFGSGNGGGSSREARRSRRTDD
jgi:hypothetical protein